MKRKFKILALFIFLLMLGGWYFSSDTDIIPQTYPNIAFQSKETEKSGLHNEQKQSWNLNGVFVSTEISHDNIASNNYAHYNNKLAHSKANYITISGDALKKSGVKSSINTIAGGNVRYGRTSNNVALAYNNVPSINFRLPVMRGYGSVDVDKYFSSDIVETGQRFGAAQQCPDGGTHHPVKDGSGWKCDKCGQVLTPISGGADGIIDWVVPLDNPLITLILFSLFYISILFLKRNS